MLPHVFLPQLWRDDDDDDKKAEDDLIKTFFKYRVSRSEVHVYKTIVT